MDKQLFRKSAPYLVAILVFLAITLTYFSPLLEGKKLKQHDITMFKGMSKEIVDFREKTGEEALWTNSMFGGMPAWQISVKYQANLVRYIDKVLMLGLPYPANYVFLYFLGFFILMLVLKNDPWVSLLGAIAFALSSYFFIILGAGHTSKAHAIGYMAPVLAGIILAFREKIWPGALLFTVALALQIHAGHLQITYYLLMVVVIYGIYELIRAIQKKQLPHFAKVTAILILGALLGASTHFTNLWATYDYGKDTMRGKPELTKNQENKSSGLDRDYITNWSYGIAETWSLLIPNAKGGASGIIGQQKALEKANRNFRGEIARQSSYWGDQPGISGPVYVGAIVVFLFVLGLFIVRSKFKWALLAATILSIFLAWGKNFMPFTDFFIDYIPGYNKFRAVSMTLVIAELTIPILAFMALGAVIKKREELKAKPKPLYYALGITAGITLLFYLFPSVFFNFLSQFELQQFEDLKDQADPVQIAAFISSLEDVRIAIFKADALRSFIFIVLAGALFWAYLKKHVNKAVLIGALGIMLIADMASVNWRYINNSNFERARVVDVPFIASKANKEILKDTDPDFRVLDITKSTFNDASCSYFHKSIGGYHGAKLQRYQDLIEAYIQPEIASIIEVLQSGVTQQKVDQLFDGMQVLNMLNTKYMIYNPEAPPLYNRNAFGHAWFVNDYVIVGSADEEIAALEDYDLKETAIIDQRFEKQLNNKSFQKDVSASVTLKSYEPNHLTYSYNSGKEQILVFSEIYYDKGWNAYLNGEEVAYFRSDYVLRSMVVPAGSGTIEFKFEPRVWVIGEKISFASSLLLILLVLGAIGYEGKKLFITK
ncbi:MAG: YfhO family protein [Bacteroidetes bacterium]|nr:YfhO family protein [Bacteroidota bacterium]